MKTTTKAINSLALSEKERGREILFTDKSEGSENGEGNDIAEDAEDDLVDANVKGDFGDDVIASVE